MIKKILVVIAVVVAALVGYAATRPDTFRVERSAEIKAPPEKVFALIDDFKLWPQWSPWEKKDPTMKRSFGPITKGKGATYAWEGNKDVGQGSMEIVESVAPAQTALKLDFVKPFEAHNRVEFTLQPKGDTTRVNWAMRGDVPFLAKFVHIFFDMDKMVGQDFEAGLAAMKAAAEK